MVYPSVHRDSIHPSLVRNGLCPQHHPQIWTLLQTRPGSVVSFRGPTGTGFLGQTYLDRLDQLVNQLLGLPKTNGENGLLTQGWATAETRPVFRKGNQRNLFSQ